MTVRTVLAGIAACSAAALTTAAVVPAPSVQATNFSGESGELGCAGINMADNATHTFRYVDVATHTASAQDWSRANNYDPTIINTQYDTSLDSLTDVVVRDQHYDDYCGKDWYKPNDTNGGILGTTECDSNVNPPNYKCEQHELRINLNWTDGASLNQRRHLACHEIAHTLGLKHRDGSCIESNSNYTALSDHDRTHLTNNY